MVSSKLRNRVIIGVLLALTLFSAGRAVSYSLKEVKTIPKNLTINRKFLVSGRFGVSGDNYSNYRTREDLKIKIRGKNNYLKEYTYPSVKIRSNNKNSYALTDGIFWKEIKSPSKTGDYLLIVETDNKTKEVPITFYNTSTKIDCDLEISHKDSEELWFYADIENNEDSEANLDLKINGHKVKSTSVNKNSSYESKLLKYSFSDLSKGANFVPITIEGTVSSKKFDKRCKEVSIRNGYTKLPKNAYSLEIKGEGTLNITRKENRSFDLKIKNKGIPAIYNLLAKGPLDTNLNKTNFEMGEGETKAFELTIFAPEETKGETKTITLELEDGGETFKKDISVRIKKKHLVSINNVKLDSRAVTTGSILNGTVELENTGDFSELVFLNIYFRAEKKRGLGPIVLDKGEKTKKSFFVEAPKGESGSKDLIIEAYGEEGRFRDTKIENIIISKESKAFLAGLDPNKISIKEEEETILYLNSRGTLSNRLEVKIKGWDRHEGLGRTGRFLLEPGTVKRIPIVFKREKIEGNKKEVKVEICSLDTGECKVRDLRITLEALNDTVKEEEAILNIEEKKTNIEAGQGALFTLTIFNNKSKTETYTPSVSKDFEGNTRISSSEVTLGPKEERTVHIFIGTKKDIGTGEHPISISVDENGNTVLQEDLNIQIEGEKEKRGLFASITGAIVSIPSSISYSVGGVVIVLIAIIAFLKFRENDDGKAYEAYEK